LSRLRLETLFRCRRGKASDAELLGGGARGSDPRKHAGLIRAARLRAGWTACRL